MSSSASQSEHLPRVPRHHQTATPPRQPSPTPDKNKKIKSNSGKKQQRGGTSSVSPTRRAATSMEHRTGSPPEQRQVGNNSRKGAASVSPPRSTSQLHQEREEGGGSRSSAKIHLPELSHSRNASSKYMTSGRSFREVASDNDDADAEGRGHSSQLLFRKEKSFASANVFHKGKTVEELLAPKLVVSPEFDEAVKKNLHRIKGRNKDKHLMKLHDDKNKKQQKELDDLVERGILAEKRRIEAFELHKKIVKDKKCLEAQERAQQWLEILVFQFFRSQLKHALDRYHAINFLKRRFGPMMDRWADVNKIRARRIAFTEERLEGNTRPTPDMLLNLKDFFKRWSFTELKHLISKMSPRSYRAQECIIHQGDFDRDFFVLTKGKVEVMFMNLDIIKENKSRLKNRQVEKIIQDCPAYLGEYALLCKEPRSATVKCVTDCDFWVVSAEDFWNEIHVLSPEILHQLERVTDDRRKKNLKAYFPLRVETLQRIYFLKHWSTDVLHRLAGHMDPHVLRDGVPLFQQGDFEPTLWIIGDGEVALWKAKGISATGFSTTFNNPEGGGGGGIVGVTPGHHHLMDCTFTNNDTLCEFECLFRECNGWSAQTAIHCDLWSISRDDFLKIALEDPAALLETYAVIKQRYASSFIRIPATPSFFYTDPFLQYAFSNPLIHALWQTAIPEAYATEDYLYQEGDKASYIYVVLSGTLDIHYSMPEWCECCDKLLIMPGVGLSIPNIEDHPKIHYHSGIQCCHPLQLAFPHLAASFVLYNVVNRAMVDQKKKIADVHEAQLDRLSKLTAMLGKDMSSKKDTNQDGTKKTDMQQPRASPSNPRETVTIVDPPPPGTTQPHEGGGSKLQTMLANATQAFSSPSLSLNAIKSLQHTDSAMHLLTSPTITQSQPNTTVGIVGVTLGTFECAARKGAYVTTVRCVTPCEVWKIDRTIFEEKLSANHLALLSDQHATQFVSECFDKQRLMGVLEEGPTPKPSGHHPRQNVVSSVLGLKDKNFRSHSIFMASSGTKEPEGAGPLLPRLQRLGHPSSSSSPPVGRSSPPKR